MDFAQPEHELLILLSRRTVDSQEKRRIEALSNREIRWSDLFTMAYNHGVFPLVFMNWHNCVSTGIDETEFERWGQIYKNIRTRNMVLTLELVTILKRLQLAKITAIPLKGPILTHRIYGDVGLRMFTDLDILVSQKQVLQALSVLLDSGYHLVGNLLGDQGKTIDPRKHHYSLKKGNGLMVELHRTLEPPYYLTREDAASFWKDLQSTSLLGITVTLPRDEEMLLFLCRHGSRHLWRNLKWLADVARFLDKSEEIDWNYISSRVERTHTKRMVFLGFYLANQLFASTLPVAVKQEIMRDRKLQDIGKEILAEMFDTYITTSTPEGESYIKLRMRLMQLREGRLQRLRYIVGDLLRPNSEDEAMTQLPKHLSFLYYILRPIRLLVVYGSMFIRYMNK